MLLNNLGNSQHNWNNKIFKKLVLNISISQTKEIKRWPLIQKHSVIGWVKKWHTRSDTLLTVTSKLLTSLNYWSEKIQTIQIACNKIRLLETKNEHSKLN